MFYGDVLGTIIDSFKEGMDAAEIERLRGMAKSFLANYNPPSVDDESDEVEDEDARKAIISRLTAADCPFGKETVDAIISMWGSTMDSSSDNAEEKIIARRRSALLQLLGMKVHSFAAEDIERAAKAMDESHAGMVKLKDFLLEEISSSVANGIRPKPILLVGDPGCGKTSLAISLASAFPERGHAVISLTGKDAAFELSGVDQAWRACTFGLILKAFLQAGSMSPIIIFDELDKIGQSETHSRADSAFLDLLQPERARLFTDAFMALPIDASNAWYIFTANTLQGIPAPLLDRLSIFQMDDYSFDDLMEIADRVIKDRNRTARRKLGFSMKAKRRLVYSCYGMSASVRPLKEAIDRVYASKAKLSLSSASSEPIKVGEDDIGDAVFHNVEFPDLAKDFIYSPGVISGISVMAGHGFILPVEARNVHSPLREVKVTGLVEQVMLESANIAYDLADSYAQRHMHMNLEAVTVNYTYSIQKRGDSASLATALAIISDLSGIAVPKTTAVTGAVSLTGNVLPVGGVLAKISGAALQGARKIIIPAANRKDVEDVPPSILPDVDIVFVSTFEEAIERIFPRHIQVRENERQMA